MHTCHYIYIYIYREREREKSSGLCLLRGPGRQQRTSCLVSLRHTVRKIRLPCGKRRGQTSNSNITSLTDAV